MSTTQTANPWVTRKFWNIQNLGFCNIEFHTVERRYYRGRDHKTTLKALEMDGLYPLSDNAYIQLSGLDQDELAGVLRSMTDEELIRFAKSLAPKPESAQDAQQGRSPEALDISPYPIRPEGYTAFLHRNTLAVLFLQSTDTADIFVLKGNKVTIKQIRSSGYFKIADRSYDALSGKFSPARLQGLLKTLSPNELANFLRSLAVNAEDEQEQQEKQEAEKAAKARHEQRMRKAGKNPGRSATGVHISDDGKRVEYGVGFKFDDGLYPGDAPDGFQQSKEIATNVLTQTKQVADIGIKLAATTATIGYLAHQVHGLKKQRDEEKRRSALIVSLSLLAICVGWINVIQPMLVASYESTSNALAKIGAAPSSDRSESADLKCQRILEPAQASLTDHFGMREAHPVTGDRKMHKGIDYGIDQGTPVRVALSGKVVEATEDPGGWGYYVVVDHGLNGAQDKLETLYAHLSEIKVNEGEMVGAGQIIGLSGGAPNTKGAGSSTGPHLHFETHVNGEAVDPESMLGTDWGLCTDTLPESSTEESGE